MKKVILSLTLVLIFAKMFGQIEASKTFSKDYYLKKSKTQKKVAWILLTGGTIMAVGGAIVFDNSWYSDSYATTDIAGFVMLAGVITDIACIPFFISAAKNKGRAASASFSSPKLLLPQQNTLAWKIQPTFKLKIEL